MDKLSARDGLTAFAMRATLPIGGISIIRETMKGNISPNYKKRALHRLKIIQGQAKGLEKMVEDEAYCMNVLHQSLAAQESLKSFDALMLENHLKTHACGALSGKDKSKAIQEILKLFRLSK